MICLLYWHTQFIILSTSNLFQKIIFNNKMQIYQHINLHMHAVQQWLCYHLLSHSPRNQPQCSHLVILNKYWNNKLKLPNENWKKVLALAKQNIEINWKILIFFFNSNKQCTINTECWVNTQFYDIIVHIVSSARCRHRYKLICFSSSEQLHIHVRHVPSTILQTLDSYSTPMSTV